MKKVHLVEVIITNLPKLLLQEDWLSMPEEEGKYQNLNTTQWTAVEDGRWKNHAEIDKPEGPVEKKLAEGLQACYVPGKKKKGKSDLVPTLFT